MNVLNFIKSKGIWIICVLSFIAAFSYNQVNLKHVPAKQIRQHQTIKTNDDNSYLSPPETYINTGEWKQNGPGKQSYFLRPPGYGLFFYALLKPFGSHALLLLKFAQLLLFSLSIYCFYYIVNQLIQNKVIALFTAALYGCTPFAIGFLFYTLTEGITPALLLFYIFLLFKAKEKTVSRQKIIFYFLAALTFAYLLIVRPPLGFMGILLPIFLLKDYWKEGFVKLFIKLLLFGSIAFSLMAIWQFRNYKIADEYVGLHSIYYADNNSIYRPTFKEYWNFAGGWAQEGHEVHAYMVPIWIAAVEGDTSEVYIKNAIATFPKKVTTHFGEERLTSAFRKYQEATLFQQTYYSKGLPMPTETPQIELDAIAEFKQLTKEYKSEFWFDYYVSSPLKVFKTMAFHSNLSLYVFQHTYRGNVIMETARVLFYGLHALCFITLIISLFFLRKSDWRKAAILLTVFSYVFYLCYFQRGIEERYTLPILPLLLIGLVGLLSQFKIISRRES